jgi:hypothetical protein
MKLAKSSSIATSIVLTTVLLVACGGGVGSDTATTTETPTPTPASPSPSGTPTPSPTPTPPGGSVPTPSPTPGITPTPTSCTPGPIAAGQPFSRVFKGCNASNVATYYETHECIRENSTGLIWQGHSAHTGLPNTHSNNMLTNYDSTTQLQKNAGLVWIAPTQAEIDAQTNTIGYKNGVNAFRLCGFSDWRLPNIYELYQAMNYEFVTYPTLNFSDIFPNSSLSGVYWSSTAFSTNRAAAYHLSSKNDSQVNREGVDNYGARFVIARLVR